MQDGADKNKTIFCGLFFFIHLYKEYLQRNIAQTHHKRIEEDYCTLVRHFLHLDHSMEDINVLVLKGNVSPYSHYVVSIVHKHLSGMGAGDCL